MTRLLRYGTAGAGREPFQNILRTGSSAFATILLATAFLLPSCSYHIDMVRFDKSSVMAGTSRIHPDIRIDDNVSFGLIGGKVQSKRPYDIHAYYFDETFTFASAVFTKVTVTYQDGTVDPGVAALKLPMNVQHTIHEIHNSMGEAGIVVRKSRMIFAEFPRTINRDEPFTILVEGTFTKDNGKVIPFTIKEKFELNREKESLSWADSMADC